MEPSSFVHREPAGAPLPAPRSRNRDGLSALERKALFRVHTELAAMPASLIVQILLWPEKITDWARDEGVTPALVYNMLGGFKPYHGLRERLAHRLGVTKGALDHLIEARPQQPSTRKIPEPPGDFAPGDLELSRPVEPDHDDGVAAATPPEQSEAELDGGEGGEPVAGGSTGDPPTDEAGPQITLGL